jgi:hypothetical protein
VTGVSSAQGETPAAADKEWTEEELKAGKPLLVYYYIDGLDMTNGAGDPNFKFSQSLEMGGFAEKVLDEVNDHWRCKKVGIPMDADRKDAKNQARLEFWSFTERKLGDITLKETAQLNPGPLKAALKNARIKNVDACAKEIKRMAELRKAQEKLEKETAAK